MIKLERLEYGPKTVTYYANDKVSYNGFIVNACKIENINHPILQECEHLVFAKLKSKRVYLYRHETGMYFYTKWTSPY
jgi:hypothetical protein